MKIEASTDVINIFKDKSDPELKPRSEYPEWLFEMVYEFEEHPSKIGQRILRGEQVSLSIREQRRIAKWTRRTQINLKNATRPQKYKMDPRRLDLNDIDMPGGEESDIDPEDQLEGIVELSMGYPSEDLVKEYGDIIKQQLGIIKKA